MRKAISPFFMDGTSLFLRCNFHYSFSCLSLLDVYKRQLSTLVIFSNLVSMVCTVLDTTFLAPILLLDKKNQKQKTENFKQQKSTSTQKGYCLLYTSRCV